MSTETILLIENGSYERKRVPTAMGGWWGYTRPAGDKDWGTPQFRAYPPTPKESKQAAIDEKRARRSAQRLFSEYCHLRRHLKQHSPIVLSSKRKLRKYLFEHGHLDMVHFV